MRWQVAILAVLGALGCGSGALGSNTSGGYDMGFACMAASGECYTGTVRGLCQKQGPAGCDENPSAPNAQFCCLAFVPDADLYSASGASESAEGH